MIESIKWDGILSAFGLERIFNSEIKAKILIFDINNGCVTIK